MQLERNVEAKFTHLLLGELLSEAYYFTLKLLLCLSFLLDSKSPEGRTFVLFIFVCPQISTVSIAQQALNIVEWKQ